MDRLDAMRAFVSVADLEGFAPAARKLGLAFEYRLTGYGELAVEMARRA